MTINKRELKRIKRENATWQQEQFNKFYAGLLRDIITGKCDCIDIHVKRNSVVIFTTCGEVLLTGDYIKSDMVWTIASFVEKHSPYTSNSIYSYSFDVSTGLVVIEELRKKLGLEKPSC